MPRTCTPLLVVFLAFSASALLQAQGKDRFIDSLERFSNAVAGTHGDEGAVLLASVEGMEQGLREWDALVANVESRFAAEIGAAPAPAAARMRTALGTVYLERGRLDDALAQFEQAATLDPQFADVHLLRGLAFELADRAQEASKAYAALWQRAPRVPAHAYLLLRSAEDAAATPAGTAARETLEASVDKARPPGGPLFPAVVAVDDAAVSAPVFAPARYANAFALIRARQYDAAVARLRNAVTEDPLVADKGLRDPVVREAVGALKRGEAGSLETLAAAAPRLESSELYRLLGLAHWQRKQHAGSLEHLRRAVRIDPLNERARLALADVLVDAGDPVAARTVLVESADVLPDSGLVRWQLGRLSQAMGDERGALDAFKAAAARSSIAGAGHVQAAIGRLYHNQLDLDAAATAYQRRVLLMPNDSAAHFDLGEVYRARGRLDAAFVELAAAALLDPASAKAFASIGQMHASAGRDEQAVAMLRRAAELDPVNLEARYALSRALLRLGRTGDAQRELEIFKALQAKAMEEERRRFKENQVLIEEALKAEPAGARR